MLKRKHKMMLDCNGPDKHSCCGCTHWVSALPGYYCEEIVNAKKARES